LDDGTDVVELAKSNDSSLRIPVMNEERMRRVGNLARLGGGSVHFVLFSVTDSKDIPHTTYPRDSLPHQVEEEEQ